MAAPTSTNTTMRTTSATTLCGYTRKLKQQQRHICNWDFICSCCGAAAAAVGDTFAIAVANPIAIDVGSSSI